MSTPCQCPNLLSQVPFGNHFIWVESTSLSMVAMTFVLISSFFSNMELVRGSTTGPAQVEVAYFKLNLGGEYLSKGLSLQVYFLFYF